MDRRIDSGKARAAGQAGVEWERAKAALEAPRALKQLRTELGDTAWALELGQTVVEMAMTAQSNEDHKAVFHGALHQLSGQLYEAVSSPDTRYTLVYSMTVTRYSELGQDGVTPHVRSIPQDPIRQHAYVYELLGSLGFSPINGALNETQVSRENAV